PAVRARLHRGAADVLERRHAADPAAPLAEIVHHLLLGGPEVAARAAGAAEAAARAAAARLAFADAAALCEKALDALAVAGPGGAGRRAALMAEHGRALARAGDRAAAERVCIDAAELARVLGDGPLFARIVLALGAEGTVGRRDPVVIGLLDEALRRLPPED